MNGTSAPVRALLALATQFVRTRKLLVLCYHRVLPSADPLRPGEIDRDCFERQLAALTRHFHVVSLGRAVALAADGVLASRSVALTFDDGYADNATIALPLLQHYGAVATVFVTSGYLDGGLPWNDAVIEAARLTRRRSLGVSAAGIAGLPTTTAAERLRAAKEIISKIKYLDYERRRDCVRELTVSAEVELPRDLMLTSAQVRQLAAQGIEIGAHTLSHPILRKLDDDSARREIGESKRVLEAIVGGPVSLFAYPNGRPGADYDKRHVEMVRAAGFAAAVSTAPGTWAGASSPYEIPRYGVWSEDPGRFGLRLMRRLLLDGAG